MRSTSHRGSRAFQISSRTSSSTMASPTSSLHMHRNAPSELPPSELSSARTCSSSRRRSRSKRRRSRSKRRSRRRQQQEEEQEQEEEEQQGQEQEQQEDEDDDDDVSAQLIVLSGRVSRRTVGSPSISAA